MLKRETTGCGSFWVAVREMTSLVGCEKKNKEQCICVQQWLKGKKQPHSLDASYVCYARDVNIRRWVEINRIYACQAKG